MNNCPLNDDLLGRLFTGDVPEEEMESVKKHLDEDCPACQEFLSGLDEEMEEAFFGFFYAELSGESDAPLMDHETKMKILSGIEDELSETDGKSSGESNVVRLMTWKALPIAGVREMYQTTRRFNVRGITSPYMGFLLAYSSDSIP